MATFLKNDISFTDPSTVNPYWAFSALSYANTFASIFGNDGDMEYKYNRLASRLAQSNPDLPYEFIRDILISHEESQEGKLSKYKFD